MSIFNSLANLLSGGGYYTALEICKIQKNTIAVLKEHIKILEDMLATKKVNDIDALVADLHRQADAFGMLLSDPPKLHPNAIALRQAADTIIALRAEINQQG